MYRRDDWPSLVVEQGGESSPIAALVVKIVYAGFPVKEDGKSPSKACTLFGYYYKAIVFIPFFINLSP